MQVKNDGGGTRAVEVKWVKGRQNKQCISGYIVKVEPP